MADTAHGNIAITCIASGIAEAFYGVPDNYKEEALSRIESDMRQVYEQYMKHRK